MVGFCRSRPLLCKYQDLASRVQFLSPVLSLLLGCRKRDLGDELFACKSDNDHLHIQLNRSLKVNVDAIFCPMDFGEPFMLSACNFLTSNFS